MSRTLTEMMQILSVDKARDIIINGGDLPLPGGPVHIPSAALINTVNGPKGYPPIPDPNNSGSYNATNKLETVILYLNQDELNILIKAGASRRWNKNCACGM